MHPVGPFASMKPAARALCVFLSLVPVCCVTACVSCASSFSLCVGRVVWGAGPRSAAELKEAAAHCKRAAFCETKVSFIVH